MKNCSFLSIFFLALIFSCQDLSGPPQQNAEEFQELINEDSTFTLLELNTSENETSRINTTCGGHHEGDSSKINSFIMYPAQELDISCAPLNSVISVTFKAFDVPNKFDIVKGSPTGIIVSQSTSTGGGWLGYANYPGPWGTSLNISATQTKTFVKDSNQPYYIRANSLTPPNVSYSPSTDFWEVLVSCNNGCPPPPPPCNPLVQVCDPDCGCSQFIDENPFTTINSFHIYPKLYVIDLSCVNNGVTVYLKFDAYDVVNKFVVKNANGVDVANSNWLGYASYPGPWGLSISGPSSKNMSFVKTENKYFLEVVTQTPPNHNYYPTTDKWGVRVSCSN